MGPRAGLDTGVRGKILCLYRGSNPGRSQLGIKRGLILLTDTGAGGRMWIEETQDCVTIRGLLY
jgi:hypothetical protein